MIILFLQAEPSLSADYAQWGIAGAIVFLVVACFYFLLKTLPTWERVKGGEKEVKLAEVAVREEEAKARAAQAASFGELSNALSKMSDVVNNVAVKQQEATEDVRHSQRVNADMTARTEAAVNQLRQSLDAAVENMTERMDAIETLIGSSKK